MDDYISRTMAIARLTKVEVTDKLATMTDAKREIADMPAADVAPVRHGRALRTWIDEYYGEWTECSVCGWDNPANAQYCNGCGARMDGGGEDG